MTEPAYISIANKYAEQIRNGTLPPGTRLPTYAEIAKQYSVSDIVVRSAITLLKNQGLVRSVRRQGVFVADPVQISPERQARQGSHRSRLAQFIIDVDDLNQGVAFWSAALDASIEPVNPASTEVYRQLRLPDSEIRVLLQHTTDPKVGKERMHLDLETDNVEAEVRRLEALGATRWDHQQLRGYDFWVMQDPWGNEFCVLQTTFPDLLSRRRPWPL